MVQDGQTTERDAIAEALQKLRAEYGAVSYREITRRVAQNRRAAGMTEAQSRVSFTTVYDLFSTDRKRKNSALVSEVVLAITGDEALAAEWLARAGVVAAGLGEFDEGDVPEVDDAVAVAESKAADDFDIVDSASNEVPFGGSIESASAVVSRRDFVAPQATEPQGIGLGVADELPVEKALGGGGPIWKTRLSTGIAFLWLYSAERYSGSTEATYS